MSKFNIFDGMKTKLSLLALLLGLFACQGDKNDLETEITNLGKQMYNEETNRLDQKVANQFIAKCEAFAQANPQHVKAAEYLLKAGETARTLRNYQKGIALYDYVLENYPDHPKAAQALFLKGFTLDNDMNQQDQAKAIYEAFLQKYPNDDFADDTEFLLKNLGKSDDEIIKSFEQNKAKEQEGVQ